VTTGTGKTNYSAILGDSPRAASRTCIYPSGDRGAGLTFENAAIGIGRHRRGQSSAGICHPEIVVALASQRPLDSVIFNLESCG